MTAAQTILAEFHRLGVTAEMNGDWVRLDAPPGVLTPGLLARVRSCRSNLLATLSDQSLLPDGLGRPGSRSTDAASVPQVNCTTSSNKIDREFDRFFVCAIPTPDGTGLFDPAFGPKVSAGVAWEDWRAFEHDCAHLGKAVRP